MFKSIAIITGTSFTGSVMMLYLFDKFGLFNLDDVEYIPVLFLICFGIGFFMAVYEKIAQILKADINIFIDAIIRLAIAFVVIVVGGCIGNLFSFSWVLLIYIVPILIPVFVLTYFITYLSCSNYATEINRAINSKKTQKNDG